MSSLDFQTSALLHFFRGHKIQLASALTEITQPERRQPTRIRIGHKEIKWPVQHLDMQAAQAQHEAVTSNISPAHVERPEL